MKRFLTCILICVLVINCCFVTVGLAAKKKAKQMEDGVPQWNEETVRQYALDYINGVDMETLWGYYDLQIRRYMPFVAYSNFLLEMEWMTGEFVQLGSYHSFEEEETQLKTHVLHLCMEKQDLDFYFTHKNKEDDWEVMAIHFVPSEKQQPDMLVGEDVPANEEKLYTEIEVTVGTEEYPLKGILTMPDVASPENQVPVVVLVHDEGPLDMDSTMGNTALFKDIAHLFGNMGVATLRYDKRTYTYGETDEMTVWEETVEDAVLAGRMVKENENIDQKRVVLMGHGFGGYLVPRIAFEDRDTYTALVIIAASPISYPEQLLSRTDLTGMTVEEAEDLKRQVTRIGDMGKTNAKEIELFGKNGYYFWDILQTDPINLLKRLKKETYIVQGTADPVISEEDGWRKYSSQFGDKITFLGFQPFRGLNHLLMVDNEVDEAGKPLYQKEVHLDKAAGRTLCQWVRKLNSNIE